MIVAGYDSPLLREFRQLMVNVDKLLNADAKIHPEYYAGRNAYDLEKDVCDAAIECSKKTEFEGTIELISGASFPDIIAAKLYGIEVKSTQKDHWTSIGSSILESTRISGIERIYLTFGKLGGDVSFMSRPYEECLCDIAVTHYPRYKIDMKLNSGQTIFDKIGIPYDDLRTMENPVAPVAEYYKKGLKPGESLWWAGDGIEAAVPVTVRLWSTLSPEEKDILEACSYVFFPETITGKGNQKYSRAVLWLATQKGIINPNARDSYSAGGRVNMLTNSGELHNMPAIFHKIEEHIEAFKNILYNTPSLQLQEYWHESIKSNRGAQWIDLVTKYAEGDNKTKTREVLTYLFYRNNIL
ncbi:MAG TPA: hypothetical protein IAC04_08505 [Candidatus Coprenecus stercoravium]|uniref:Restriction endonuclease n=1 Tax=Candidatus Coprenecus stercoravium TaxID=2840735 RepID=A0A9D2GQU9_9BACT|nr:hypothetical protein [Candidatus Coprenecus stercoravium]